MTIEEPPHRAPPPPAGEQPARDPFLRAINANARQEAEMMQEIRANPEVQRALMLVFGRLQAGGLADERGLRGNVDDILAEANRVMDENPFIEDEVAGAARRAGMELPRE